MKSPANLTNKVCGFEIGKEVCEALGLDPKTTRAIDIHIAAGSLVTATVEHTVSHDESAKLINVLTAYSLTKERDVTSDPVKAGDDITPIGDTLKQTAGA